MEALIKSHRGRCGKNEPRARRLGASIPAVGCKRQANTAPGLLSPHPGGLKPFVDFCGVSRSGETAAGIAQHSRLQKSANALQRPSWDLISASLGQGGRRAAIPVRSCPVRSDNGQREKPPNPSGASKGSCLAAFPARSKPAAGILPRRCLTIQPPLALARHSPVFRQSLYKNFRNRIS